MKTRNELLAAMEAIQAAAVADSRDLTTEETAEFDRLDSEIAKLDEANAAATQRAGKVLAMRQGRGAAPADAGERNALRPDQQLASVFPRPAGKTERLGDFVRNAAGLGSAQNVGTGSAGGFTVPEHVAAEIIDKARAKSRLVQAGARYQPVVGVTNFTTVEQDVVFAGHEENSDIPETEVVFGSRRFQPRTLAALARVSIELAEDSPNFNAVLEDVFAAAFAVQLDYLGLFGSGSGEQLGLMNTPGIHTVDGSAFTSWRPFSKAYQAVASSNYQAGAFITSPAVVGGIDGLVDSTGQPLSRPPSLVNTQFLDTTSIAAGNTSPATSAAVTGQFDQLWFAQRTGLTLEVTRTGGDSFNRLSLLVRGYARIDSFAVRPAAFAKITNLPVAAA